MITKTEYSFELPIGYVDDAGQLHKQGTMRLATAADEILPMSDPRVQRNPSYASIIILSRVITQLGTLRMVNPAVVESVFSKDFTYLQELYNRINNPEGAASRIVCPKCEHSFEWEPSSLGEA